MKLIERTISSDDCPMWTPGSYFDGDGYSVDTTVQITEALDVLEDEELYDILIDPIETECKITYSIVSISAAFEAGLNHCKDNQKAEISDYLRYRSGLSMSQADEILARIVELL